MAFIKVTEVSQIAEGEVKQFIVEDKTIAVANVGGEFFVVEDTCSHERCSLSEGFMDGKELICPCHGAKFDVTDGRALTLPATLPITSYEAKVKGGDIIVDI